MHKEQLAVDKLIMSRAKLLAIRSSDDDETAITIEKLRELAIVGGKANIKLEMQLNLLKKGKDASQDSTQAMYEYAKSNAAAALAEDANNRELIELIGTLNELSSAYDATKAKLNEIEEAWDANSNNMKGAAKSAAESMQDAFVEFLIEPTKNGFDDMLQSFLNMAKRMVAENLAKKLFNGTDGTDGLGSLFTSFFRMLSGDTGTQGAEASVTNMLNEPGMFATGGSFKVAGSGGIDSELIQFMATPGEKVTISNPSGGDDRKAERSGGDVVTFHNEINISGGGSNKEETRSMINQGLKALEGKILRQQQRVQKPMGIR